MNLVEQSVESALNTMISNGEVFTALDVSNAIKKSGVACRHGEAREYVRNYYRAGRMSDYTRCSIVVTLPNQDVDQAMLYYPDTLSQADLEDQYPLAKRAQTASPSPNVVVSTAKMLTRPKMLGAFLMNKAKQFVSTTNDSDDVT